MTLTAAPSIDEMVNQLETGLGDPLEPDDTGVLLNAYAATQRLIAALQAHQGQLAARLLNASKTPGTHRSPSLAVGHLLRLSPHIARKRLNRGADLAE